MQHNKNRWWPHEVTFSFSFKSSHVCYVTKIKRKKELQLLAFVEIVLIEPRALLLLLWIKNELFVFLLNLRAVSGLCQTLQRESVTDVWWSEWKRMQFTKSSHVWHFILNFNPLWKLALQWSRNNIANETPQPQKYSNNAAPVAAATDFVAESAGSYSPAGFPVLCLCGRYSDCAGTWWHLPDWRACCWRPAPYICWRKWLHQRDHLPGEKKTS